MFYFIEIIASGYNLCATITMSTQTLDNYLLIIKKIKEVFKTARVNLKM